MTIRARNAVADAGQAALLGVECSLGGRRWADRLRGPAAQMAMALAQRHDLPEIVARVLAARGVGVDEAPAYLDPTLKALLPEPNRLTGMEAAAERLARAIVAGERIAIVSDYDVDGATSAALMLRFLAAHGTAARLYVPDRVAEGYGPNVEAVRILAGEGARLLVTLDCGTTSHAPVAEAKALGLDVVVIDHHQADETLPAADALVNPNRLDCLSGQGHLAAVGVTFLVLVAVNRLLRARGRADAPLLEWLDLAALGTVCDVVPLKGLNRAFVVKGLGVLRARRSPGLRALCDLARVSGPVGAYHLGFVLGPRINAGGRIGRADLGARLLALDADAEAGAIAAELDRLNVERQGLEQEAVIEAVAQAEAALAGEPETGVLVAASADWHPGIVGLIAARLKERFARPAFALALDGRGAATGSGRSVPGVDLGRAVREACADGRIRKGGGHAMAAGVTLGQEDIEAFRVFLETRLGADVAAADASRVLEIDGALSAASARIETVQAVERAGPFGAGNPAPCFVLPAHRVASAGLVGAGHVRASLIAGDGARLSAIAFRAADSPLGRALLASEGAPMHIAGSLRLDHWNGRESVKMHITDAASPT